MGRGLPQLNALRAFEAAARHLSFSRAAEELHVSPAAVSHQIRALEDYLGVALFYRTKRSVVLSEAGELLAPGLTRGFGELTRAVEAVAAHDEGGPLVVSAAPTFASTWLVPRLERFRRRHPEVEVRLDASAHIVDFTREAIDVAIRYGAGGYDDVVSERLFAETVSPVCSPALLRGQHPLRTPEDLRHHTLLHQELRGLGELMPCWWMWLLAAGVEDVDASRGPRFNHGNLAVQSAVEGHGVALASDMLVVDHLAAGRLVKPFHLSVTGAGNFAFYLVAPERAWRKPRVAAFRQWLLEEARETETSLAARRQRTVA